MLRLRGQQCPAPVSPPASPTAVNDTSSGAHNTPQTIAVLGNDTKDPALTLVASSVRLCGTGQTPPNCTLSSLTVPGEGTYTVNPVGTEMHGVPVTLNTSRACWS